MNIKKIISRPSPANYEIDELKFVVQEYIKEKKGVDVEINLEKGIPQGDLFPLIYSTQLNKLNLAFDVASKYFLK